MTDSSSGLLLALGLLNFLQIAMNCYENYELTRLSIGLMVYCVVLLDLSVGVGGEESL
jgi:hypothetical protein